MCRAQAHPPHTGVRSSFTLNSYRAGRAPRLGYHWPAGQGRPRGHHVRSSPAAHGWVSRKTPPRKRAQLAQGSSDAGGAGLREPCRSRSGWEGRLSPGCIPPAQGAPGSWIPFSRSPLTPGPTPAAASNAWPSPPSCYFNPGPRYLILGSSMFPPQVSRQMTVPKIPLTSSSPHPAVQKASARPVPTR